MNRVWFLVLTCCCSVVFAADAVAKLDLRNFGYQLTGSTSLFIDYTDLGFLPIVKRDGNKRMYNDKQVRNRLSLISKMMNEGYPLRLIRRKIVTKEGGL